MINGKAVLTGQLFLCPTTKKIPGHGYKPMTRVLPRTAENEGMQNIYAQ
jgi:hypothetical protein